MATTNSTTGKDSTTDAAPAAPTSAPDEFLVLTTALTVKVGKAANDVARYFRGARIKLNADLVDIENLLRLKAIGRADGTEYRATTARTLAAAAGAPDDPVPVPDAGVIPEAPTTEQIQQQG